MNYDDIIDLPHPVSTRHAPMPLIDRGAQFSPFAALVGYDEAVMETARLTGEKIILDDDAVAAINRTLMQIDSGKTSVAITHFVPDMFKSGGEYLITSGTVKKIDRIEQAVILTDGTSIHIDDIFDISFTD
jgi:hypothetical protein